MCDVAHIDDLWYSVPRESSSERRRRTARHGTGNRWRVRWTDPAGRERSKSFPARDEAESFLTKLAASIRAGEYQLPTGLTLSAWFQIWAARQEHWRPSTLTQRESQWRAHVDDLIGAVPLELLRPHDVQRVADQLAAQGLAWRTRTSVLGVVRSVTAAAVDDGLLVKDPAAKVRAPRRAADEVQHRDVMTLADVAALVAELPGDLPVLARLIAGTGIRIGEARSVTVDRLALGARPGRVTIDRQLIGAATRPGSPLAWGPPKGGKRGVRTIALPDPATDELDQVAPGSGFLFTSSQYAGRPLNPRSLAEAWETAARRAGLNPQVATGWHALRHHHASRLIAAGISVVAVQRRLGHASPSITLDTYSHLWPSDESAILAALG